MAVKSPNTARPEDTDFRYKKQPTVPTETYGEAEGSPIFNGLSPGVSPTDAAAPVSIASVLNSSTSNQTMVGTLSTSGEVEKVVNRTEEKPDVEGFKVL